MRNICESSISIVILMKEEGRRKKEEGRRKKEEGRGSKILQSQ
ncbi:hypothetical protein [Microcoleus sp. PH2017_02_FOX_O_A]|nr:hypothetical protein [Microcoleus sp. PH2017_02_FOX_O_A]